MDMISPEDLEKLCRQSRVLLIDRRNAGQDFLPSRARVREGPSRKIRDENGDAQALLNLDWT